MAEKQASYIQASSHPADTDRLVLEGLLNPSPAPVSGAGYGVGPVTGDLLVTQNGTPNMSVNVAAGHVWIDGTESATQGAYHCYNDATKNLVIAASDPTNARKDLVIAKVQDAAYSGAVNAWSLAVVTGTPAASPAEPAIPANAVVLAMINVAALATTITNANITDRRRRACGLSGVGVCLSTTRPAAPYVGQVIFETDTDRPMVWDGSSWKQLGLKYDPPSCRVYQTGTQAISAGTETALTFGGERYDTDGMHDNVTNNSRITINTPGLYAVGGHVYASAAASGMREVFVRRNANVYDVLGGVITANAQGIPVSTIAKYAAGEYIELRVNFAVAVSTALSGTFVSEFYATWVGRG